MPQINLPLAFTLLQVHKTKPEESIMQFPYWISQLPMFMFLPLVSPGVVVPDMGLLLSEKMSSVASFSPYISSYKPVSHIFAKWVHSWAPYHSPSCLR